MIDKSAPTHWHIAANLPFGILWMLAIPFGVCWLSPLPLWWAIPIAPIWSLLTTRVPDQWIPGVTAPIVDRIYTNLGHEKKSSKPLKPESDYIVNVTDSYIRSTRPDGTVEELTWEELTLFEVETNSLGPFAPDVFWILHGDERGCIIPQGARGDGVLLERLQQLNGFDNETFTEAMASTSERIFRIWDKTGQAAEQVVPAKSDRAGG